MTNFSHLDDQGQAQMVDVGQKPHTARMARASCQVHMRPETMRKIQSHQLSKGDVLQVARLAGIMAAKQTPNLIPLCHPLPLDAIEIKFEVVDDQTIAIESTVRVTAQTGVEMEALMAASIAALTIYDMCKSIDRSIVIHALRLEEKLGGKSGHFQRKDNAE